MNNNLHILNRNRFFFLFSLIFSYNNASEFSIGRCPKSKSLTFNKSISYVTAPCLDVNTRKSFTYSVWMYLKFTTKYKSPTFYADIRGSGRRNGFFLSVPEDQAIRLTVILGGDSRELLKSIAKIKLNTWTHFAITFDEDTNDLSLYIDGKKQEYASLWQGIDYFKHLGEPTCTIGNMPESQADTKYQLYGSVMDLYILSTASDDIVDLLRGTFHVYMYKLKYLFFIVFGSLLARLQS